MKLVLRKAASRLLILLATTISSLFILSASAQTGAGPAGINNGIKMWLDASDIDGDGNTTNDPANNASLNIWRDKSGLGNHATTVAGKSNFNYIINTINGKSVARFTKIDDQNGTVLEATGVDIRAVSNPNITIFTVYRSGAHPAIAGQGHALWGNDNQAWDRFFYSSWNFTDNGIVSLGPTGANFANITGSGTTGALRLMTAVYNHGVAGGSAIYFDGVPVTTFTDNTSTTDAFPVLSIGRDGDNGTYNGDIAEMIVYNRKLTDCEILTINQYLGNKYGVTFTSATISAGGPTTICAGASVNLTASAGSSYQWFKDNVQIPGATASTYSATNSGAYTVNITSAAGCTATSLPTQVTVNALPTVAISSSVSNPVCLATPVTLTATTAGNTITWSPAAGINTTNGAVVTATPNTTTTYTATARDASGLCTSAASYTVVINPLPAVNDIQPLVVCNGASVPAFTPNGSIAGASYSWTNSNTGIGLAASGNGTVSAFTATNATNAPLVSTVTVTASTATDEFAYVTNYGSNNVSVINLRTNTNVATIPVGQQPYGVAVSAEKKLVYIANYSSNTVSVIDATTNTVTATINTGTGPKGVILSKDGNSLYVTHREEENVRVYSTATLAQTAVISLGSTVYKYSEAGILSPDGSKLYVLNGNNRVFIINTQTNTLSGSISVGYDGRSIAMNQDGSRLYVTSRYPTNVLQVINTATNSVIQNIPVGNHPYAFALTPDGTKAFVAHFSSFDVYVVDVINYTTLAVIPIGGNLSAVNMSTDGTKVYVSGGTNRFNIIDANTFTLTKLSSSLVGSISYSVGSFTLAANAGCTSAPKTYTITVNPTPTVTASVNTQTICSGATINPIRFSTNTTGTVTYNWQRNQASAVTGSIGASGTGDIQGTLINTTGSPVTVEFTVTPVAANCNGVPVKVYVTVNPVVTAIVTATPKSCANTNDGTITITASGASSFEYSINGGVSFVPANTFTNLSAGNYSVLVKSESGCISAATNVVIGTQPDVTAPVPNVSALPDITAQCSITITTIPTATDNCSGIRTATTTSPLVYNTQGTFTITWRYTDAAGNITTQTQKVIVKDDTAPVVNCPAPITVVSSTSQCGAVVTYSLPVATDNCSSESTGVHTLERNTQFYDYANGALENQTSPGLPTSFFPTDGQKLAVFLVNGGTTHYMYQNVSLAATGSSVLAFDMKYTNHNGSFNTGQYIAVELRNANTGALLTTLFKTNAGAANSIPMTHFEYDISAYAGQQVRVQIIDASITNFYLDVQLDNITIPGSSLVNGSFETGDYTGWTIGSQYGPYGTFGIGSGPGLSVVRTAGLASGSLFPIGTTTNTFEVTDRAGNKTTCSFDVTVTAPEIKVSGNNTEIVRGDVTPSTTDDTDFGGTTPGVGISKVFTIANTGTSPLTVNSINSSNANFVRSGITLPAVIQPGQSAGFTLTFNTQTLGVQNAIITINNNDCNEASYSFAVKAEIICTNPVFSNVNVYLQASTAANSCTAVVNYPLSVAGIPAPGVTYTFTGATTGTGSGTGSGQLFNKGITNVLVRATNACTTTSTSFDVTVVDDVKPVVITRNITAYLDASGQATINPADVNNGSTDNCGPVTLSLQNSGIICATAAEGGSITLTAPAGTVITAINFASYGTPNGSCGNFTIGSCHASNSKAIVEALALNKNSVTIPATNSVFVDPCNGTVKRLYVTATYSGGSTPINTFDCSKKGENTVVLIVTDENGNSNTGTAVVTVVDNLKPVVNTKNITVQLNQSGTANITAAQINNGSTDNCAIATVSLDKTSFTCNNIGANTVTLTVTDVNGNSESKTAIVTVEDKIAPSVFTQNITVQLAADGTVSITPAQINNGSTDNCAIATMSLDKTNFTCTNVGTNTVTLTVTDVNGNTASKTAIVMVEDKIAPTVLTQNIAVQLLADGTVSITPAQINIGSTDNCTIATMSLDKTSFTCSNVGANTVTLTVTDVNGNSASSTAIVTVEDKMAPTVLTQNITVQLLANGTASINVAQINNGSTDNCAIATMRLDKTSFTCSNVGENTVTLTVTDVNGNSASSTAIVTVEDKITPTVLTQNITVQLLADGTASINVAQINNGSTDNCAIATMSLDKTNFTCSNVGANTVILTVTDVNGNSASNTAMVTVEDNIAPTVLTQNITIQLNADGEAVITPSQINNGSFDNCEMASITLSKTLFTCGNVGANTVVLTVKDIHGNQSTATAVVTVQDLIAPTVITRPVTVNLLNGGVSITAAQINNGSFDNCGIASITVAPASFNCNNIGGNTVTLTVTDVNGNVSSATAIVTVVGTIPTSSIKSVPTSNVFTGGNPNNLYLGYGAQSTVLQVTASQGNSFSYSWSGTATTMLSSTTSGAPVFTPTVAGNYTFIVTTTNNFGCVTSASITICVKDIRVPGTKGSGKVFICHLPPGNKQNPQTLEVSVNAVAAHLTGHSGDRLGACDMTPCAEPTPTVISTALASVTKAVAENNNMKQEETLKVTVMPNPSTTYFTLKLESKNETIVNLRVTDAAGRMVEGRTKIGANSTIQIGHNYHGGLYYAELIQGNHRKVVQLIKVR